METFFARALHHMLGRMSGPLNLRLFLQPLMASIMAVRAGLKDSRTQRPPYLRTLIKDPAQRQTLIREGLKDVGKVFIVAFFVDVVYQVLVLHWYYPVQALIVAFVLAVIPYILLRGPTARIARRTRASASAGKGAKAA